MQAGRVRGMKDFSQNGEGKIIADYFGGFVGTLLDIGANDGMTLSNSRGLIEAGWSGVLVEPAAIAFSKLTKLYVKNAPSVLDKAMFTRTSDDIILVQAAITTQDGPVDFYDSGTHLKQGDTSLLSTTRPEELARWKKSGEVFTKTTVRGITFSTLVKECGLFVNKHSDMTATNQANFDFISIDAEGADYSILEQIPLQLVGCRMLCVETNGKDNQKFIDYCAQHGMRLHRRVSENLIFAR